MEKYFNEFYKRLNECAKKFLESCNSTIKFNGLLVVEAGENYTIELSQKIWGTICEQTFISFIKKYCKNLFSICHREPKGVDKFPDILLGFFHKNEKIVFGAEVKTSKDNQINCGIQHAYTLCQAINISKHENPCEHLKTPFIIFKYHVIDDNTIHIDEIIIKEYWKIIAITTENNFGFKSKNGKAEGRYFQEFNSFSDRYNELKMAANNYFKVMPSDLKINNISEVYNYNDYKKLSEKLGL